MAQGDAAQRILRHIEHLRDTPSEEVDALLFACADILAHRLDMTPRTILDQAFRSCMECDRWPATRALLVEAGVV